MATNAADIHLEGGNVAGFSFSLKMLNPREDLESSDSKSGSSKQHARDQSPASLFLFCTFPSRRGTCLITDLYPFSQSSWSFGPMYKLHWFPGGHNCLHYPICLRFVADVQAEKKYVHRPPQLLSGSLWDSKTVHQRKWKIVWCLKWTMTFAPSSIRKEVRIHGMKPQSKGQDISSPGGQQHCTGQ